MESINCCRSQLHVVVQILNDRKPPESLGLTFEPRLLGGLKKGRTSNSPLIAASRNPLANGSIYGFALSCWLCCYSILATSLKQYWKNFLNYLYGTVSFVSNARCMHHDFCQLISCIQIEKYEFFLKILHCIISMARYSSQKHDGNESFAFVCLQGSI